MPSLSNQSDGSVARPRGTGRRPRPGRYPATVAPCYPVARTHPCSYRILGPCLAAADIDSSAGSMTLALPLSGALSKYFLNNVLIAVTIGI